MLLHDFLKVHHTSSEQLLDDLEPQPHNLEGYFIENCFNANVSQTGKLIKKFFKLSNQPEYQTLNAKEVVFEVLQTLYFEQGKVYQKINGLNAKKNATKKEIFRRLLLANDFINDSIYETISIEDISKNCFMSEYHLYRSFKKLFKRTPNQHITLTKMLEGKRLINQRTMTISEVAYKLGYIDLPTFSKAFKRTFGYSPSSLAKT